MTSPDRLYADWISAQANRARGERADFSHVERLLSMAPADAVVVTVVDGHPLTLSWLGSVQRHSVHALGVTRFGQSGDVPALFEHYRIDAEAIATAVEEALVRRRHW